MSVLTISMPIMKQVVKVRMLATKVELAALEDTLRTCNTAASWLTERMHNERMHRKHDAHSVLHRVAAAIRFVGAASGPGDQQGRRRLHHTPRKYPGRQLRSPRVPAPRQGAGNADPVSL